MTSNTNREDPFKASLRPTSHGSKYPTHIPKERATPQEKTSIEPRKLGGNDIQCKKDPCLAFQATAETKLHANTTSGLDTSAHPHDYNNDCALQDLFRNFIEYISNHSVLSLIAGDMFLQERFKAKTKLSLIRQSVEYLSESHALGVPDIALNISPAFSTSRTTVLASDPADSSSAGLGSNSISYSLINLATRPYIVNTLFNYIIKLGKSKSSRNRTYFYRDIPYTYSTDAGTDLSHHVQFIGPTANNNGLPATSDFARTSGDAAQFFEPLVFSGPRHTGKSHIMYLVALKMMAAPNVVVMYIGDCKDLCVSDIEYEQYKYVQFIEHIACAFCEYTFVKTLADIWYIDTSMGTNYKAMKTATSKLLDQIKQMCREQKVTLVAFFDNYEAIVGVASFDLIASAFDFAYKYEAVVVTSYSDAMGMDANTIAHMHQCVLPIPLNHEEAMNMSIVTHGHVDISDDSLKRIFEAADYHPIDIVRTLSLYENRGAALYDYDDAAEDRLAGIDSVQRAINDHCLSRGIRLADMHMRFFSKELEVAASQMDSKSIVRSPEANNVINTDTPEFDTAKRGIMSTVFYLYHGFEPKHGSVRDPQFLVTECNARSDGPRCDYDTQKPQATKDICRPAAAIDAMYNIHFHGTVHEQFSWLLGKINFKLELEPHIRARYFDLCLLETGNLDVVTKDIFGKDTQITAMRFTEITGHNYLAYKVGDPRKCTTFDDAIEYIDAYTKASKESPPRIKPYAAHAQELRYSVVIYFQNLGFSGSWISQSTASCASFQGSFMAAVTRVDLFQPAASSSVASTYSGCEFEIVWIVSDPLKVITNHSLPSASMSGAAAVSSSRVKTKSSSADSVAGHYSPDIDPDNDNDNDEDSSYRPPRENIDYDTVPGAHHSWTARAIDLFPDIKRRCQAAISDANIASVRMLTLTADTRVDKLSTAESLQNMSSLASLRESQNSQSRDIRVAKTSSLSFYKNISVYF